MDYFDSAVGAMNDPRGQMEMGWARGALERLPPITFDHVANFLDASALAGQVVSTVFETDDAIRKVCPLGTPMRPRLVVAMSTTLHVVDMRTTVPRLDGTLAVAGEAREAILFAHAIGVDEVALIVSRVGVGGAHQRHLVRVHVDDYGVPRRASDQIALGRANGLAGAGPGGCVTTRSREIVLYTFDSNAPIVLARGSDRVVGDVHVMDVGRTGFFGAAYDEAGVDGADPVSWFDLYELRGNVPGADVRARVQTDAGHALLLGDRLITAEGRSTDIRMWDVSPHGIGARVQMAEESVVVRAVAAPRSVHGIVPLTAARTHVAIVSVDGDTITLEDFVVAADNLTPARQTATLNGDDAHVVVLPTGRLAVVSDAPGRYRVSTIERV